MRILRRKSTLIMLALAAAALGSFLVGSWLAEHSFDKCWSEVHPGMTKAEVKALLGPPQSVYQSAATKPGSLSSTLAAILVFDGLFEKWAYGERRLFVWQQQFPFVAAPLDGFMTPEDDDYVVFFSLDGKVAAQRHPYREAAELTN